MFQNWIMVAAAQYCECTKCHSTVHFKMVFMLHEFRLKKKVEKGVLCIIFVCVCIIFIHHRDC